MASETKRRIVRRNVRITFQQNETYSDRYKNRLQRWTDFFSCFAYASTYELQESGDIAPEEERKIIFETRWCPELSEVTSTGYRVVFGEENYNILSVDMMNYQKKTIRFVCRKEKP